MSQATISVKYRARLNIHAARYPVGSQDEKMAYFPMNLKIYQIGASYSPVCAEFCHGMNIEAIVHSVQTIAVKPIAIAGTLLSASSYKFPLGIIISSV